jgi:hypothetical protein
MHFSRPVDDLKRAQRFVWSITRRKHRMILPGIVVVRETRRGAAEG